MQRLNARAWSVLMLALTTYGCTAAAAEAPGSLPGALPSQEALVGAVLEALEQESDSALVAHLASREDWERYLWPEMPDRETTPFEFIYGMSADNSRKGRAQALQRYGGMPLELVSVSFSREAEVYPSFTFHKGAEVTVRNRETGEQGVLPVFDVFVEYRGGWKLLDYNEL